MSQRRKRKLVSKVSTNVKRAKMSNEQKPKASMNDLPNEILLEIFTHLRYKELLRATLVNRNWNNLISNTQKTMKHIDQLFIKDENIQQNGVPCLARCYQKIHIDEITEWNSELFKCLREIGSSVKRLVLFECVFFDTDFKDLIDCFKNIEELEIWDCHPGISPINTMVDLEKIVLPNLKYFTLKGYSWPLRLIDTPNLKNFEAESLTLYDQEWLMKFLNQQTQLHALHLIDIIDLFNSRFGTLDPQFELKELVLYDLTHIDHTQFFRMLDRVKHSVETVDIGFDIKREITEYVLANFQAMTSLSIDCDCLPHSMRFYNHLKPSDSLKSVSLYGCVKSSRPVLQFLKKHPKIEILKMKSLNNLHSTKFTFWNEFSKATPNVCCLSIGNLESYNMVYMKSTKMVHLDVDFVGHTNEFAWLDFCRNNPNLQHFYIFRKQRYFDETVEQILFNNLPRLQNVYVDHSN